MRRSVPPVFPGAEREGCRQFPQDLSLTPEKEGPLVGVPNSAGITVTPTTGVITVNADMLAA